MPGPPDPATVIRQQYPGWTIWVSDTRRWWAFRKVELTAADIAAGCVPFLHADDPAASTSPSVSLRYGWMYACGRCGTAIPIAPSAMARPS